MWACLLLGNTYCGICFTEEHRDILLQRMCKLWKDHLADTGPGFKRIYNAKYATAVQNAAQQTGRVDETATVEAYAEHSPTQRKVWPSKKS